MWIKDITIKNFRGFDNKHFTFDSRMNVILGDNTRGKTTLLHAIQIALGAYLQAMKTLPGGKSFSRNFATNDYVKEYSDTNKDFIFKSKKPFIGVNADFFASVYHLDSKSQEDNVHFITWNRSGNKISKKDAIELMEEVYAMEKERIFADTTNTNSVYPLFLAFGSNRLEKNYRKAQKTKARESRIEKAYKCSLDGLQVDFKSAFNWIYKFAFNLKKGSEFEETDLAFIEAIAHSIPAIKGVKIDSKNSEFTAKIQMTRDPEPYWLTYDMMSDGFKAMINITAEIAYRCIQLNGFLGHEAVRKTPGIVMIDEIDLFLHPHWQQHVLEDLKQAFPMIQFIVTTHSPFIVQSVESHNVITLDGEKGSNPQMRSIEDIALTEMNMDTDRFPKYNKMVDMAERYYQLVKEGKELSEESTDMKKELDAIEAEFAGDPAYVALLRAERNSR